METTSSPHEPPQPSGRPGDGAAAARTAELYGRYRRTVSGLCTALLRDRAEAEDATQQTFLSAHRALLNGSAPREPAAWLATIARNECWARIKARMREPLPSYDLEAPSDGSDPLGAAIRRADLAALWLAIEALPPQQRDALLLREFGGLSYVELAAALAVTPPAVESLLFRARARLRAHLRATYASVTGASWLEALARVFAGGGAAPVAAKVAALGIGTAAVTGGAVITPQMLDHHHRDTPPPAAPKRAAARTPPPATRLRPARMVAAAPAAIPAAPQVARRPAAPERERRDDTAGDAERERVQAPAALPAPRPHARAGTEREHRDAGTAGTSDAPEREDAGAVTAEAGREHEATTTTEPTTETTTTETTTATVESGGDD